MNDINNTLYVKIILFIIAMTIGTQVFSAPIGAEDALVVRDGSIVTKSGREVRLFGVNIYQSHMHWARRQNHEDYRTQLAMIAEAGFNAVRMPLNMAYFMPEKGVLPDDPRYPEIMAKHKLPSGAMAFYDGLVEEAARLGIYVIPEFHELPTDPYRWFAGGIEQDRDTGKAGKAVSWMARLDSVGNHRPDEALAMSEIPKTLAWMARYWKGNPAIAGIEVPWNEPRGPLTEPEAFAKLVAACADAIKEADPDRLVFLCPVDWGAMVNNMPDVSVWKIPDSVDVMFPHFYPGMHSNSSGEAGTWSTSMASWISWLAGSGRPVMVGEYGTVEMHRAGFWKDTISEKQKAITYSAAVAQWAAQGVQGVFAWAWEGGVNRDETTGLLKDGAHVLPLWADAFSNNKAKPLSNSRLAVVCAPSMRAQYGTRHDLWKIADTLMDTHKTPFATIFDSQVIGQPGVLSRFDDIWVITNSLAGGVLERVHASGARVREFDRKLAGLNEAAAALKDEHAFRLPSNIIAITGDSSIVLFERKGTGGAVHLHLMPAAATGHGSLVTESGVEIATGLHETIRSEGYTIELQPWSTVRLNWISQRDSIR